MTQGNGVGEREERERHRETERDRDRETEEGHLLFISQRLPSISHFADEETKVEKRRPAPGHTSGDKIMARIPSPLCSRRWFLTTHCSSGPSNASKRLSGNELTSSILKWCSSNQKFFIAKKIIRVLTFFNGLKGHVKIHVNISKVFSCHG